MKGSWANTLEEDEIAQLCGIQYWLFKVCLKPGQPVQSSLALPRRHTKHCPGQLCRFCCLGQHFHNEQCVTNCVSHSLPFPGAWSSGSPSLPILSHQPGCHAGGAGSPSLSQMVLTAPSKTPTCSHCSGLRGPVLLHWTPGAPLELRTGKNWEQQWMISCTYRAAAKVSAKLVLETNLIASRNNFSGLHFLALILCIAVCVSEQNLIIRHLYEPWWLHAASAE